MEQPAGQPLISLGDIAKGLQMISDRQDAQERAIAMVAMNITEIISKIEVAFEVLMEPKTEEEQAAFVKRLGEAHANMLQLMIDASQQVMNEQANPTTMDAAVLAELQRRQASGSNEQADSSASSSSQDQGTSDTS